MTWGYPGRSPKGLGFIIISPAALAANVDDYDPPNLKDANVLRVDPDGVNRIITGIVAVANISRLLLIVNIGSANTLTLANADVGSVAANRILGPGNVDFVIAAEGSVWLFYDMVTSRWRVAP